MPRKYVTAVWAGLPVIALSYAVLASGGEDPFVLNVALLLLAAAGVAWSVASERGQWLTVWERRAILAALLFPSYVAFQLVPLPLPVLGIVDPARAAIADAIGAVFPPPAFAQASILPGNTWAYLGRTAGYALVFLLVFQAVRRSTTPPWRFVIPLVVLGTCEALLGLAQYSAGGPIVAGTYLNQNHFSGLLEMVLPLALVLTVAAARRVQHSGTVLSVLPAMASAAAASVLMFAAIPVSVSRAGFVSMLGSLGIMAAVAVFPAVNRRTRRLLVPTFAIVCVLAFFSIAPPELIENFGAVSADPREDARWAIILDTLRMLADYPLLGTGLGTYYPGFLPYQTVSLNLTWMYVHNDYLQLLAELGAVGFVIIGVLIVIVLGCAVRAALSPFDPADRLLGLGCVGSLAAILLHSFADFNLYIPANAMVMAWAAGIAVGLEGRRVVSQSRRLTVWPALPRFVGAMALWLACFAGGWLAVLGGSELDPATEARLCKVGICNSFAATNALAAGYGGDIAAASPEELRQILVRDPAGAYNWLNLGESFERRKLIEPARASFSRALELGPHIPFFQMKAAHFHLRQREYRRGLELMARSIDGNPMFRDAAFDTYANHEIAVDDVLRFGVGSRDAAHGYLRKLLVNRKASAAAEAWILMMDKGWADDRLAADYVNHLVEWNDYDEARRVWFAYGAAGAKTEPGNYIFNGDFESDPTDSRFDWKLKEQAGVRPSLDSKQAFSGKRAARLDFDGTENVHRITFYQPVYLPPARYTLAAMVKVEEMTTREGLLLEVAGRGVQVETESLTGSSDWVRVVAEFEVPADAGLLQVSAVRKRSFRFDNKIRGTAWIDQVRIYKSEGAETS